MTTLNDVETENWHLFGGSTLASVLIDGVSGVPVKRGQVRCVETAMLLVSETVIELVKQWGIARLALGCSRKSPRKAIEEV